MWHRGLLTGPARRDRAGAGSPPAPPPDWPARLREQALRLTDARLRAYAAAGVPPSDTPIASLPMAALDFETTGLDPARDEIVSIGLVPFGLDLIQASRSRHWVVRPRRGLAPASVPFHGITDSQVAAAPDLDAVLDPLLGAMAGRVMVVHCGAIERGFLAAALQARLGEALEFPVIDTMDLAARCAAPPAPPRGFWRRRPRPPRPSLRLADCRQRLGLPAYRPHHAPTDALATAELLLAQLAEDYAPSTRADQLWS